ncbi:dtd2, partial [Symbiodinium sp. KB8]
VYAGCSSPSFARLGPDKGYDGCSPASVKFSPAGVHVVVQRCSKARLLVAESEDKWTEVGRGLVLYVSFSKGAASEAGADSEVAARCLKQAAKSLLTAPLSSSGQWQSDHGDAESVLKLCSRGEAQSLLIVPQASLVCKLELGDRNLKYHQQCPRDTAATLFHGFAGALRVAAQELLCTAPAKRHQEAYEALAAKRAQAALVPPEDFFKQGDYEGRYSRFDDRGVPTHAEDGSELPKSAVKKLVKIYEAQVKKFSKATASEVDGQPRLP